MELALLVWLVDLLGTIGKTSIFVFFGVIVLQVIVIFCKFMEADTDSFFSWNKKHFPLKTWLLIGVLALLIPNEKTMKYMGAGYLIQTTFESDFVQESATLSQKAILKQLEGWSVDSEEVKELIKGAGLPIVEDAAKDLLGVAKECKVGPVVVDCTELDKITK